MTSESTAKPGRSVMRRICVTLVTVSLGLLVAGLGYIGLIYLESPAKASAKMYRIWHGRLRLFQPNEFSYELRPNLDTETVFSGQKVSFRTNSLGMRQGEVGAKTKPRICFVGDSFTYGMSASSEDNAYVARLANAFDEVEILNFGVPGHGFNDTEYIIRSKVLPLEPDWVVLASFSGNDWRDTLIKPAYHDGKVRIPDDVRAQLPEGFLSYKYWSLVEHEELGAKAVAESIASLERIHDLSKEEGFGFALVAIPYWAQVEATTDVDGPYDMRYPQAYLNDLALSREIPYLDMLPAYRSRRSEILYFTQIEEHTLDPHWNDAGHAFAAELIEEFLRMELLPALTSEVR